MKNRFMLNKAIIIITLFSTFIVVSCNKENILETPDDPSLSLSKLKDSASYTIDGKRYTCDISGSFGRGNEGANRDSVTGYFQADTILYYSEFGLIKQPDGDRSDDGEINVTFIKKYAKNPLASYPPIGAILRPKNILEHYTKGNYGFAMDYLRNNRQNGVALMIRKVNGNTVESLVSYINAHYQMSTTISPTSHDNSSFEITRLDAVGDGSYLLEAKFSANLFDRNETLKRVENGYLRFRVN